MKIEIDISKTKSALTEALAQARKTLEKTNCDHQWYVNELNRIVDLHQEFRKKAFQGKGNFETELEQYQQDALNLRAAIKEQIALQAIHEEEVQRLEAILTYLVEQHIQSDLFTNLADTHHKYGRKLIPKKDDS